MIPRKFFEVILYLGLLAGGLLSVHETWEEYSDGTTSFSVTREPMSLSDLPTIIACWFDASRRYKYGDDLEVEVKILEKDEKAVTLLEDKHVPLPFDIHAPE